MALIIDGYNLLHATDIFGTGPHTLENSRHALLDFLCEVLPPKELRDTTIVFDAMFAPPGLPSFLNYHGLSVRFAPQGEEADTLIEEMIEDYYAPRQLTIISSDHRLHRAARRRKAKAIDSDVWYADILRVRKIRQAEVFSAKPPPPSTPEEVQAWLKQFENAPQRNTRNGRLGKGGRRKER